MSGASTIDRLLAEPHRFEFFQAVRQLERWFVREEGLAGPQVLSQRIVFRNSLSLAFPASEVAEFRAVLAARDTRPGQAATKEAADAAVGATALARPPDSRDVRRVEMTPAFIGLLGAGGTLPAFYTELVARREAERDGGAARAFLDVFLHRAVVLFYRAWRKHRMAVEFEADRRQRYLPLLLAVAGIGHPALRDRLRPGEGGVGDETLAFFAGALQQRPVSAATMQRVLAHYFGVAVKLDAFVGRWFRLPDEHRTALGRPSAALGAGAVVGERVWQRDLRMRLTIGPMALERFRRFLPGGPAALALREWLTLFTGTTLEYEVRLALRAAEVPPARLGAAGGARLGRDGFLLAGRSPVDRDDAGYDLHAIA